MTAPRHGGVTDGDPRPDLDLYAYADTQLNTPPDADAVTPFVVAGEPRTSTSPPLVVRSPVDGRVVGRVAAPTSADADDAANIAADAAEVASRLPVHMRADALNAIAEGLRDRRELFAQCIVAEGGKPLKWARIEVDRAVATFRFAAEECRREGGELLRLDTDASADGRLSMIRRFSKGPVLAITPFNFPLNLVAHKVAPAIAVGSPIIVKPAPRTPLTALLLAQLVRATDLPPAMLSVLPVSTDQTADLVRDPRLPVVSFTGSAPVGWMIKAAAPRKTVLLELGGNSAVVVHSDADLSWAAKRLAFGAYYQAGQACVSAQRLLVHADVAAELRGLLADEVERLRVGDPADADTDVGPLIDATALERVERWVGEAVTAGGRVVFGGARRGGSYLPTLIEGTGPGMRVWDEEVFGPVLAASTYVDFRDALARVNDSRFGLQAGVFTQDVNRIFTAYRELKVGGIMVNDVPTFRADQMPYGGVKDSGVGREGVRYAMADLTEPRLLVISGVDL